MNRHIIIFFTAWMAFLGSSIAVAATITERDFQLRGYVDATQTTDLPYRLPRLGVNAALLQYTPDELRQQLVWMQAANITWVRQFAYWDDLEPQQSDFQWEQWDTLFAILSDYPDLRPVIVFMNTPQWARPEQFKSQATTPPQNPEDFALFTREFALRYGAQVDFYQVWDEPNLDDAWGLGEPRPAEYAALLQSAYTALHSADPVATVIAAALAPTQETGGQNISDWLYLEDLYALGAADFMDAVAAKPYGFDFSPDDRTIDAKILNFSRIIALREIMLKNGDGKKALWASNFGWNSLPENWSGAASIWGSVNAQQQQDYTLQAIARADREWVWLGGLILHHWQPDAALDDPQWGFALITQKNDPSPLWQALTQQPQTQAARDGLYHPITPFARYSGLWTFNPRGADIGWLETSDSQLEFDFYGRAVALLLREDDYVAFLYPKVDGQPANATPRDSSGNAYLFLRSASLEPETNLNLVSQNLPLAQHTLHVIADKGWDRWALAGYAVSSGNLAVPYQRQINLGIVTALLAGSAVLVTGWQIQWQLFFAPLSGFVQRMGQTGQFLVSAITSIAMMLGLLLTWGNGSTHLFSRLLLHPEKLKLGASSVPPDILLSLLLILITGGLVLLQPGFIITIVSAAILFVVIYNRLYLGLLLTLFYAPFFLFPVELYIFAFPMAEILILMTTGAWLLRWLVTWGRARQSANRAFPAPSLTVYLQKLTLLDWSIIGLVGLGVVSLLWTARLDPAITELRTLIIEPALFYLILRTTRLSRREILGLVDTLVIAGVVVAAIGLFLYFRCVLVEICIAVIEAEAGTRRLASVYGSPNNVGLLMGRCVPFALAYLLADVDQKRRIFGGFALAIMSITVLLTQSVGSILLGIPAGIFTVLILRYGKKAALPAGLLGAGGIGGIFILTQISARFAALFNFSDSTGFIRLRLWESSFAILRDFPLTGLGLDQFLYYFRSHYIRPDAIYDKDLSHPHNVILDFWIRLSIVGVGLFIVLQITFWRMAFNAYRRFRATDALYHAITMGAMGCMAALLAHGWIDNSVFVIDLAIIFVFVLGLISHLTNTRAIDEDYNYML
jgi:O-antigen ligase